MLVGSDIPAPQRVLIIKPSALGDVVTAVPVLRGLRRTLGREVRIDWLIGAGYAPLMRDDPDLDQVVEFSRRHYGAMWHSPRAAWAFRAFCRRLRDARYDWVIDLQGLFRSGFFTAITRATVRAGFSNAREGAGLFYNHRLATDALPVHTVDRNIALARSLGIDARPEDYYLNVPSEGQRYVERFLASHSREYVVVAPATRWVTKLYPSHHWQTVVRELARRITVVLMAGPEEKHLAAPLAGERNVIDLSGQTNLPQMVGLIAASRGLLSCDSAPMNIATATGVPQVTVIGPTDPARTGPYGRADSLVQTHLPCRGCLKRRCGHISCMQMISPQDVLAAAERNLRW